MAVKIPPLLHKMSQSAQKAWYKKNNMEMPSTSAQTGGKSAAAAKRVKVAPRKASEVKPDSVRAINAARQAAYMAKGGRAPIGAAGSGGSSVMAGSNMSTVRGIITGIKAGFNPTVSLDPYESERAKKTGPRSLKLKKEEVEQVDEGSKRMSAAVKLQRAFEREKTSSDTSRERGKEILAQARAEYAKKQAAKTNEEVEQVDEATKRALNITKADLEVIKSGNHETVKNHMAKMISRATDHKTNARPLRSDKAKEFLDKIHGSTNVGQLQKMAYNIYLGGDDEGKAKYGKLHVYNPQSAKGRDYQKRYGIGEEVESVNEDQAADMQKIQSMDKGSMVGGKTELNTHLKYLNAMHTHQKKYGLDTAKTKKKIGDVSRSLVQMGEETELDEGKYASTIAAIASAAYQPKVGDKIRTRRGGQIPGEVTKVTDTHVHFKHPEGKTYKTSISNVMREEIEQVDEVNYKKYLKVSQEKRPLTPSAVAVAMSAEKEGNPNPVRKLRNTQDARKFANKQLTKQFAKTRPAQKFPVYEPGRTYVGDSVELDGPVIDEANSRNSATAMQQALTPKASDVKAAVGTTARDKATTNKYARRISKLTGGDYSKQDVKDNLKSLKTEDTEMDYIEEKLTAADPASKWISDFVKSDNPKFAGKSKKERIQQALGAYYSAKGKKNEEIVLEEPKDAADVGEYDYEGDMAKSQLRSIMANSKRMYDMLEDTTNLPEWVQSKITLAEDYIVTASNYMESEMNEEVEQVDEVSQKVVRAYRDKARDDYEDAKGSRFMSKVHGDDTSDDDKKIRKRAAGIELASAKIYGRSKVRMGEEAEQVDEVSQKMVRAYRDKARDDLEDAKDNRAYFKAHNDNTSYEDDKIRKRTAGIKLATKKIYGGAKVRMREEVVTEAEGTVAVTPKEKSLAAHHGDKTKITFGDVIKARLKSAAAKKMGK